MIDSPWSPEDSRKLKPFFTNLDQDVFGLKLPQEVAGALFSRYSRSVKGLRQTFRDEFLGDSDLGLEKVLHASEKEDPQEDALKKARAFYDRVLIGYGDDSVAQLGGAHIACENISNIAANYLEDSRIGMAPLEKSTRYVRFDKKNARGEFPYYREPRLLSSPFGDEYIKTMDLLFKVYSSQLDSVMEAVQASFPLEDFSFKHPQSGESTTLRDIKSDEVLSKWAKTAYRSTVRAHACDILRGLLPMSTKTNVGVFGVGQAFEYQLSKLYSCSLVELRSLASSMHRELNFLIPSFVKRAAFSEYHAKLSEIPRKLAKGVLKKPALNPSTGNSVHLIDYDRFGEDKVLTGVLFTGTQHSMVEIREAIHRLSPKRRFEILGDYLSTRRNRREKPGRAIENVYYTFELVCNIGIYRDLHRHRILTQERQAFTVEHGFDVPPELIEMGRKSMFDEAMQRVEALYRKVHQELPMESQYMVPMAYRVRWYLTANLRELFHIAELRTMPQGHPDYRWVAQEMWRKVQEVHPALASFAKFIDWKTYRLGRMQSELRTEYKKSSQSSIGMERSDRSNDTSQE